jgi:hypothetical protein
VLLAGAAAFGSACGGSGSRDTTPPGGAGAGNTPGGGATGTAGGSVVPGGGESSSFAGTGTGGGSATCDSTMMCCKTTVCACPYPAGDGTTDTIADMESGSTMFKTATVMTASGYWDWSNDATGTVTPANNAGLMPAAPGANGTTKSLHVTGMGHTGWGAALAAELSNGCPFDASKYGGISFWAMGSSTVLEGANKLLIMVGMPEFIPTENGGFCNDTVMPPDQNCYARHRVLIDLTPAWKQYTIAWTDLAAPTYLVGGPTFNPNRIRDIVFNASGPSATATTMPPPTPASFDFYVDELEFVAVGTPSSLGGGAGGASGTAGTGGAATAGAGGAAAGAGGAATAGAGGAAAGSGGVGGG